MDSVVETFDCLIVCSLLDCKQIFSFFPLSSFSYYTVQYRRVQYSTVIYLFYLLDIGLCVHVYMCIQILFI